MNGSHFYLKFLQNVLHTVVNVLELQNLDVVKYGMNLVNNSAYTHSDMHEQSKMGLIYAIGHKVPKLVSAFWTKLSLRTLKI